MLNIPFVHEFHEKLTIIMHLDQLQMIHLENQPRQYVFDGVVCVGAMVIAK